MWYYKAFGLVINSEIELPELGDEYVSDGSKPNNTISIKLGRKADFPNELDEFTWYKLEESVTYLRIDGVGDYVVTEKEILFDRHPDIDDDNVRLYVLGSGLGALLHQRRMMPIHASSVSIDGRGVLFSGESGFGKSTMCESFVQNGASMLSDDVTVCLFSSPILIEPAYPQVKLWDESLKLLGIQKGESRRIRTGEDKFAVQNIDEFASAAVPIRFIFVLEHDEEASSVRLEEIVSIEKINAIQSNIYRPFWVSSDEMKKDYFTKAVSVGNQIKLFKLIRPKQEYWVKEMVNEVLTVINDE